MDLVDPQGTSRPVQLTVSGTDWQGTAELPELIPGRHRLYPKTGSGALLEPGFFFFDLAIPAQKRPFALCMTYDIPDDIRANYYSPERLTRQFQQLSDCGIRRLYWIDYPPYKEFSSFWDWAGVPGYSARTFREFGDILPAAARTGKQLGFDFMGVFKPFDLGFSGTWGNPPDNPRKRLQMGLVQDFDRSCLCAWPEIARHQEWTIQANSAWQAPCQYPVQQLTVYSAEPIPSLRKANIRLWVSKDNVRFSRHTGEFRVRQGVARRPNFRWTPAGKVREAGSQKNWFLQISGLNIMHPFLAVEVVGKDLRATNQTFLFMEALDRNGREAPITLSTAGDHHKGLVFGDKWSWANHREDIVDTFTWQNRPLGIAFAERPNLPTVLEPSYPGVRALWLTQVERILKTEADGVDIRTLCHHNVCLSWLLFAFAPAVRDAFRQRFGRDVQATDEDYERDGQKADDALEITVGLLHMIRIIFYRH